jgi:D-alanyl-D-alanine endopeptidase (penicillin-binding protein 7)
LAAAKKPWYNAAAFKFFVMKTLLAIVFVCVAISANAAIALDPAKLRLASANAVVVDGAAGSPIYAKAADEVTPIASVTKLMTAMVVLDAAQPLDEVIEVDMNDFDFLKGSRSRLRMGAAMPRKEMLRLALMSSENRAASSLARHYPGGVSAFVAAMNIKAAMLGMDRTHYADPTGLSPQNVSTANDLARLVRAAADYPLIREFSTTTSAYVEPDGTGRMLGFNNSNGLVRSGSWDIQLQKTGYIREAGRCVVMLANIASKPVVIVLLDSIGKYTRIADAERVRYWLETGESLVMPAVARAPAGKSVKSSKAKGPVKGTMQPKYARSGKSRRA